MRMKQPVTGSILRPVYAGLGYFVRGFLCGVGSALLGMILAFVIYLAWFLIAPLSNPASGRFFGDTLFLATVILPIVVFEIVKVVSVSKISLSCSQKSSRGMALSFGLGLLVFGFCMSIFYTNTTFVLRDGDASDLRITYLLITLLCLLLLEHLSIYSICLGASFGTNTVYSNFISLAFCVILKGKAMFIADGWANYPHESPSIPSFTLFVFVMALLWFGIILTVLNRAGLSHADNANSRMT